MSGTTDPAAIAAAEDAQADADLEAGAAMEAGRTKSAAAEAAQPAAAASPAAAAAAPAPTAAPEPKPTSQRAAPPKHVQITEEQFARLNAAAEKTANFEQQLARALGTLESVQTLVRDLQNATPRGFKVEIPKDAFAALEKDFPEIAAGSRAALEATLKGITGTAPTERRPDPEEMRQTIQDRVRAVQIEVLEDEYPDWRQITGAVEAGKQPDPNQPFRKWLASKPAAFQARINNTQNAAILARAIGAFQRETAVGAAPRPAPAAVDPKAQQQRERIRAAVQPRGDGAQAAPRANTDDEEFEAGFRSR